MREITAEITKITEKISNMEISENKKIRTAVLVTYVLAVVCLILGLCLPLFDGKTMLAAQLPDVFNHIAGNKNIFDFGKPFTQEHPMALFGKGKEFDFMAWVMFLYAFVTLFGVIALIPAGLSYKKQGKALNVLSYIVEIAAVLIISLYVIIGLQYNTLTKLAKSLLIAFGGVAVMLLVHSCVNKKRLGGIKLAFFILSLISILLLFSIEFVIPKLMGSVKLYNFADKLKISTLWYGVDVGGADGVSQLAIFFESKYGEFLKELPSAKEKAVMVLSLILAIIVFFNYVTDTVSLSTNAGKKGLIFNCARYGLEILALVALFITVKVCKYLPGLLICLLLIICAIQLAISIVRLVLTLLKEKAAKEDQVEELAANLASAGIESEKVDDDLYNTDNYNASPYPYPSATYAAPDKPITDYKPVKEYKAKPYKSVEPQPVAPVNEEVAQPPLDLPEYMSPEEAFANDPEPMPEPQPEPQPQPQQPAKEEPHVHNVYATYTSSYAQQGAPENIYKMNTVYQGPTDEFMRKLSNQEKIEFSMIFIEKTKGEIGRVPDYIIGGDNRKFFSSVFIYLGRMRSLVSDGLLNKMYKELNML